ncbi:adenosylhomocysteinase [Methylobacter sp.]|uniref:adenosylhomocysteinase n=1 Tax=Methylobacter sp. TaxID=2051955 RepID=UPI002FDE4B7A
MNIDHDIKKPSLAEQGRERIEWALTEMPVVSAIHDRFARQRPLAGVKISGCLHITNLNSEADRVSSPDIL